MKTFLSFLIIAVSLSTTGQINSMWPDSNAIWVNTIYDGAGTPNRNLFRAINYHVNGEDTLLNNLPYTQVRFNGGLYKGGLRTDSGKVYFIPKDSATEYLLYDFTADVGDTITDLYMEYVYGPYPSLQEVKVYQVDTVFYGGEFRRQLYLSTVDQNIGGYQWIEGIGCYQGLFMDPFPNISNFEMEIECFSIGDSTIYPQAATGKCVEVYVGAEEFDLSESIDIYPNPTSDLLTLQCSSPVESIRLFDINGVIIQTLNAEGEKEFSMNLSHLPKGIYTLEVSVEGQFLTKRIILN